MYTFNVYNIHDQWTTKNVYNFLTILYTNVHIKKTTLN